MLASLRLVRALAPVEALVGRFILNGCAHHLTVRPPVLTVGSVKSRVCTPTSACVRGVAHFEVSTCPRAQACSCSLKLLPLPFIVHTQQRRNPACDVAPAAVHTVLSVQVYDLANVAYLERDSIFLDV